MTTSAFRARAAVIVAGNLLSTALVVLWAVTE